MDLANLVTMEHQVRRETPAPLALRDQGECLDLLEVLDPLATLLLASLDQQAVLAVWDLEESPV